MDEFLGCPACNPEAVEGLDKQAFVDALGEEVVEPMIATQELVLSRPYVTRFYTTLSAPEMDLDPLFDFNPDLPDISNLHTARRVIECHRSVYQWEAPSRFELEDGRVVRLNPGDPWPFLVGDDDAPPANALVLVADDERAGNGRAGQLGSHRPGPCGSTTPPWPHRVGADVGWCRLVRTRQPGPAWRCSSS